MAGLSSLIYFESGGKDTEVACSGNIQMVRSGFVHAYYSHDTPIRVSPGLRRVVVHHVDDPARWVQGGGGRQGDAEVAGVQPEAAVGRRSGLDLDHFLLHGKLRLGNAFGATRNDPPLIEHTSRHIMALGGMTQARRRWLHLSHQGIQRAGPSPQTSCWCLTDRIRSRSGPGKLVP